MSGAVPPLAACPLQRAARVPRPVCPGCRRCGRGDPAPTPQRAPLRAGIARCRGGGRASPGGMLSTVVRGAWCQALSLPRPPVFWSGQPGSRVPCVPGAVGAGVGTQHRPHSVPLAGWRCSLWGWRKGVPWGGAFHHCEGRLRSGAVPPPTARPLGGLLGSAIHVLPARVCWCGGPTLSPWPACPVGAACHGGGGGPSPGGVACHRFEGRLVSGAVPPPAARPLERGAWVPRPVCPRCGRCGRGDPAPAPQRAPLRASVARCGGGGRASPGGGAVCLVCAISGAWCCCGLLSVVRLHAVLCCVIARCAASSCGPLRCTWPPARVVGCPVVRCRLLCSPALPWCPAPLCCAPWCCAAVWCCGVVSSCLVCFLACVSLLSSTLKTTAKFVRKNLFFVF